MKKLLLLTIAFSAVAIHHANAQMAGSYTQMDLYSAGYYAETTAGMGGAAWGTNGFATVDEQDRLMNEAVAALRRREQGDTRPYYLIGKADKKPAEKSVAIRKSTKSRKDKIRA